MSQLQDARRMLATAKSLYASALKHIDTRLHAAVCQDPTNLDEARAIQSGYAEGFTARELAPLEQPPAPPEAEPEATGEPAVTTTAQADDPPKSKSVARRIAASLKRDKD